MNDEKSHTPEFTAILIVSLIAFLSFFGFSIQRIFVPLFAKEELKATVGEVGLVVSISGLTGVLLSIPSGLISDKLGRGRSTLVGSSFWGLTSVALIFTHTTLDLIFIVGFTGFASVFFDTAISALVADISSAKRMGRAYGTFTTAIPLAMASGPAAGGLLIDLLGFRITFLLSGSLMIIGALIGAVFLKLYKPPASRSKLVSLSLVKTVARNRNMWIGLSLIFPVFLLLGGTQPFIPLYSRLLKFDNTLIGVLFAIQFCITALSRIPSGLILDKVKKEFILGFPAVLLASILVAFLALVPEPLYLIGIMSLVGCGIGIANPVSTVMIVRSSGIVTRGLVMSLATTFRSIGFTIGPATVAILVSSIGESTTGYQFGFSALGALAICLSIIAYIQYRILPKSDKISNF